MVRARRGYNAAKPLRPCPQCGQKGVQLDYSSYDPEKRTFQWSCHLCDYRSDHGGSPAEDMIKAQLAKKGEQ